MAEVRKTSQSSVVVRGVEVEGLWMGTGEEGKVVNSSVFQWPGEL